MIAEFKNNHNNIQSYINQSFLKYKNDLINNFLNQVKDEELKGESCKQYNFHFYLALYLVTLVYQDFIKNSENNWEFYIKKYNLYKLRDCLLCNNINLNDVLNAFELPILTGNGINFLEVEETLEIEPIDLSNNQNIKIDLISLLNYSNYCKLKNIC